MVDVQARALYLKKRDNLTQRQNDNAKPSLGLNKIEDTDMVLTHARSFVVQRLLMATHAKDIKFSVLVVGSCTRFKDK
ncbi:hypothetical protein BG004_001101 [Podila humilis]|nr:hypothetical protein BG004_001101 [Podila humilis]